MKDDIITTSKVTKDPETRAEVEAVAVALRLFCPGAYVRHDYAGAESAWVQKVRIPLARGAYIVIRREVDGWQAVVFGQHTPAEGRPLEHNNRGNLMEVLRDSVGCALLTRPSNKPNN